MGLIEMSPTGRRRWSQIRANGQRSFVLRHGVLGWGLPMSIWMPLGHAGFDFVAQGFVEWNRIFVSGLAGLPIWLAGGVLFGCWMWSWSEHSWHRPHPPE